MASTGVLPFVRGIDFTNSNFENYNFPEHVSDMTGLRWLQLKNTGLQMLPIELQTLQKLEHLSLVNNHLVSIGGCLPDLASLRVINARRNDIDNEGIDPRLFTELEELSVLDLSHNQLRSIPEDLEQARSLIVLNLSHNNIEHITTSLFVNMTDLIHLDLSHNGISTLPQQMRRLSDLQTLILNDNPLFEAQLRQLQALTKLETLHLRNTKRSIHNFPTGLESLTNLQDVDLSCNDLPQVPESLYQLGALKRLDLSSNAITELSKHVESWSKLETINLSRNKLTSLPSTITRIGSLRRINMNSNQLDFQGIPAGIGKLSELEVFSASHNNLEMIPESLCRCGKLKRLVLNNNRLISIPDAHYYIEGLQLDIRDNPDLVMPPKPAELNIGASAEYYFIDFSLANQLRQSGANIPISTEDSPTVKDSRARKIRLMKTKMGLPTTKSKGSDQVLKGMREVAKDKGQALGRKLSNTLEEGAEIRGKRWDENLVRPQLNYEEIFESDVGQIPGLTCWEIENFLPVEVDEALIGKFYTADCYILLQTFIDSSNSLDWKIYYWIGDRTSIDKKACSAIHAVNLRNLLGAECRTVREEQADESEPFLALFGVEEEFDTADEDEVDDEDEGINVRQSSRGGGTITYIDGARTASGFYTAEELVWSKRMYRISGGNRIHLEPVPLACSSLDPRYVFLLDNNSTMYIWVGKKARLMSRSKTRLFAEKISKTERKDSVKIVMIGHESEPDAFWEMLGSSPDEIPIEEWVESTWKPAAYKLYKVGLGKGYLELPQVHLPKGELSKDLLNAKSVYILDCFTDVFVWIGRKSAKLVRAAALKLSQELLQLIPDRPTYATSSRCLEGTESLMFKSKFIGWDDVLGVDFTRSADSVSKKGADLVKHVKSNPIKTDLSALFMPRQSEMAHDESEQLIHDWNDDLDSMESFVYENKKFVRLSAEETGIFYSGDCYIFLCRYWEPVDAPPTPEGEDKPEDEEEEEEEAVRYIVYFWQGRDATNIGWLSFTFSLRKKLEAQFKDKLDVARMYQQQENLKFLSHFKKRFCIRTGRRPTPAQLKKLEEGKEAPEMFYIRANGSRIATRAVQIPVSSINLNSHFCYILKVPFDGEEGSRGIIYVWLGEKSDPDESHIAEDIAIFLYNEKSYTIQMINEGEEPENFFWVGIGGKKTYDHDASFMQYSRLFRCSNDKGYFTVSEKCSDFCQDDLSDEDVMILDNGNQVFLWRGNRANDIEVKLGFKSAQLYVEHTNMKQPDRKRKLLAAPKYKESRRFTKCFHGWGRHKAALE